jgi:hypothetical protein
MREFDVKYNLLLAQRVRLVFQITQMTEKSKKL